MAIGDLEMEKKQGVWRPIILTGLVVVVLLIGYTLASRLLGEAERGPDPDTIVSTSLQAMQAQNRLTPFTARFVAVVTSRQRRFGGLLSAERTLILPGTARYEIDMASLTREDLEWDPASSTLTVTLPELEIAGPDVDLEGAREYADEGILGAVTDAEEVLSDANQAAALRDLRAQARSAVPMNAAREAARDAVARNFELPLAVAGMENARVVARFASDPDPDNDEYLDASRRPADAIRDRNERRARQGAN
ncbi:DUF4230 domain-containing protein [Sphingomicrobium sp. XHP0239]|uniref:DUF4230 domain-containing protein n=1 Tax=Sphingomicrobium maritimum TaxID=3133972 RepID=UPI0031CCD97A